MWWEHCGRYAPVQEKRRADPCARHCALHATAHDPIRPPLCFFTKSKSTLKRLLSFCAVCRRRVRDRSALSSRDRGGEQHGWVGPGALRLRRCGGLARSRGCARDRGANAVQTRRVKTTATILVLATYHTHCFQARRPRAHRAQMGSAHPVRRPRALRGNRHPRGQQGANARRGRGLPR
jgi:hypothetical protein